MSNELTKEIDESLELLDAYGELLTEKQRDFFRFVYEDDLSFSEIAENEGVSKAAVSDLVKRTTKILNEYEEKLQIVKKNKERNKLLDELEEHPDKMGALIEKIRSLD